MPVRRHEPIFVPSRASTYATRHDYGIEDSINRADYLSNAVLQDTYDAASRSRGKDHELLRNLNAAIRSPVRRRSQDISPPTRAGRAASKRYQSLPPGHINSKLAVLPYRNLDKIRSALSSSSPAPSSLLSSRINSYLRGATKTDNISPFTRFLPSPRVHADIISDISYKPFLPDPSSSSLSPPSSILSRELTYPSLSSAAYRSSSPSYPSLKLATYDRDYLGGDDDEEEADYEPETSYKRKYKIIRSPPGGAALTYPRLATISSSQASDTEYDENDDDDAAYSCPRPSGTPSAKLSSYDGDYDGSYEADMAEMYDYVPFGPSRQGILELSRYDNYVVSPSLSSSASSSYLTSSPQYIRSLPASSPASSISLSSSVVPQHSSYLDDAVTRTYQPNTLLDSLVSDTVSRAKKVLANSKLPDYKQASLLLSVEGSAVSEDGKNRYGFRYYPPPIPLKGSHIGLDERILGISPKSVSPADSFLSNYLNRLRDIRSDVRDQADKRDYGRIGGGGGVVVPTYSSRLPTYSHSTLHLPVHVEGRAHSVPVSSYRSRLHDGQSHRVDVFPLVVSETTLPSDKNLHLPYYKAGLGGTTGASCDRSPNKLTVLEKINIKAAIIGSRMEAADGGRRSTRPRSDYAANKLRELKREEVERRYN